MTRKKIEMSGTGSQIASKVIYEEVIPVPTVPAAVVTTDPVEIGTSLESPGSAFWKLTGDQFKCGPKIALPAAASDPAGVSEGEAYFNTTSKVIRIYYNSAWHAAIDTILKITPAIYMQGGGGFAAGVNWAAWEVVHSDAAAWVDASMYVELGGSFKLCIAHISTIAARTDAGHIYLQGRANGEASSWDLPTVDGDAMDLVNTAADTQYITKSAAFTLGNNEVVRLEWYKDNNPGTGTLGINAMWLERQ